MVNFLFSVDTLKIFDTAFEAIHQIFSSQGYTPSVSGPLHPTTPHGWHHSDHIDTYK